MPRNPPKIFLCGAPVIRLPKKPNTVPAAKPASISSSLGAPHPSGLTDLPSPSDVGGISILRPEVDRVVEAPVTPPQWTQFPELRNGLSCGSPPPPAPPPMGGEVKSNKSVDDVFKECQSTFTEYVQTSDHSLWANIQPLVDIQYRQAFAQLYKFNDNELDALIAQFREAACHAVSIRYLNDFSGRPTSLSRDYVPKRSREDLEGSSAQPHNEEEISSAEVWRRIHIELTGLNAWPCIFRHVKYLVIQRLGRISETSAETEEEIKTSMAYTDLKNALLSLNQNDIAVAFVIYDQIWESLDNKGDVMYRYDVNKKLYISRNRIDLQSYLCDTFKPVIESHLLSLQMKPTDFLSKVQKERLEKDISIARIALKKIGSPPFIATISIPTTQRITDRSIDNRFKERLDSNRHLFAIQAGQVIDTQKVIVDSHGVRRMEIRDRTKEDACTFEAPEPYDLQADGTDFHEFLMRVMGRSTDSVECVLRLIAYSMTGFTDAHVSPLCLGETRAGKSVFNHIIDKIFGDYYIVADQDIFIKANRSAGSATYYLSELRGKRFAGFVEVDATSEWAAALFKRLVGGDKSKSRKLYQENETNTPTHKLWIFCNDLPKGKMDDAMLARIIKIDFRSRFPTSEQDLDWGVSPNGRDVYRAEKGYENRYDDVRIRSGALNVILDAMVRWLDSGKDFAIPECFKASKRELAKRQNNVGEWAGLQVEFLDPVEQAAQPELLRAKEIKSTQLYQIYLWWCKHTDDAGEPVTKEKFYLDFPRIVKTKKNIDDYYVHDKRGSRYKCLKLIHDTDEILMQLINRA